MLIIIVFFYIYIIGTILEWDYLYCLSVSIVILMDNHPFLQLGFKLFATKNSWDSPGALFILKGGIKIPEETQSPSLTIFCL